MDAVTLALGEPDRISSRLGLTGATVVWHYAASDADRPGHNATPAGAGTGAGTHARGGPGGGCAARS